LRSDEPVDTVLPPPPVASDEPQDVVEPPPEPATSTVLGVSVEGRDVVAHHFGTGPDELLFVGGIHGGYSWNTVLVARELMDHLEANPDAVPENMTVTVIPVLNPDGLQKVVGTTGAFSRSDIPSSESEVIAGRFNANDVDLNRNFDCDWQEKGVWRSTPVSGGSEVFSEPESKAVRDYIASNRPTAVVIWYSAAGGVFASNCHNGVSELTRTIMNLYATASKYRASDSYDFYEITGDMANWLAKNDIPTISVLLSTHSDTEWKRNLDGIEALLDYYGN
jgi:hypothetical protein